MKRYGCSRHGAVMGPCSRCYMEEVRDRAIRRCRHINLQYRAYEWRSFSVGGIAAEQQQELGMLACADCPADFHVELWE